MKILVCISHVPDTTTKIKFINNSKLDVANIQWIINPWDELALTRALEIKEAQGTNIQSITVACVGGKDTEATLRKALAIGADDAIRINCEPVDAYFVAYQLAEIIKQKSYDLILCGVESADFNGSSVGMMVAGFLDVNSISSVSGIYFQNNEFVFERDVEGTKTLITTQFPLVAVIQKGITKEARIPSMRGIMTARTKPLSVIEPSACEPLIEYSSYELPSQKGACTMILTENIAELATIMKNEIKVL